MSIYYKVEISAENLDQANAILNSLLAKKLVVGGQMVSAPARFLWKGKSTDMDYVTIMSFTTDEHREAIETDVRGTSVEEVPMVIFQQVEGNSELLAWVDETLRI